MTSLAALVRAPRTRLDALEAGVIAYALLAPDALTAMHFRVSPAAAEILDVIVAHPDHARADLRGLVFLELTQFASDDDAAPCTRLADLAASATVEDVAQLGSLRTIVDTLDNAHLERKRPPQRRAA